MGDVLGMPGIPTSIRQALRTRARADGGAPRSSRESQGERFGESVMRRTPVRTGMSNKLRFAVFARDEFTCIYCGSRPPDVALEVDHYIPVASGGSDDMWNLATACTACNSGKSDMETYYTCTGCPRPVCKGPLHGRSASEINCCCECHDCEHCKESLCDGADTGLPEDCNETKRLRKMEQAPGGAVS
jgi:hypothetical protein